MEVLLTNCWQFLGNVAVHVEMRLPTISCGIAVVPCAEADPPVLFLVLVVSPLRHLNVSWTGVWEYNRNLVSGCVRRKSRLVRRVGMVTSKTTAVVNDWERLASLLVCIILRKPNAEGHVAVHYWGPVLDSLLNTAAALFTLDNFDRVGLRYFIFTNMEHTSKALTTVKGINKILDLLDSFKIVSDVFVDRHLIQDNLIRKFRNVLYRLPATECGTFPLTASH